MTARIGPVTACMSLASPEKGGPMPIPSLDGGASPVFEDLHIIDMVSLQRSADEHALHRFSHVCECYLKSGSSSPLGNSACLLLSDILLKEMDVRYVSSFQEDDGDGK